jgi:hypothetical protein
MKEFLHKSQDGKDLYYFHRQHKDEKDSENPLFMSIIDLEKACVCPSVTSNLDLDIYRPNIFLAPLRDDRLIIFDGIASELVKYNFQSPITSSNLRMTAPVLCSDNILAVLVDAEVIKSDDQAKIEVFKNGS